MYIHKILMESINDVLSEQNMNAIAPFSQYRVDIQDTTSNKKIGGFSCKDVKTGVSKIKDTILRCRNDKRFAKSVITCTLYQLKGGYGQTSNIPIYMENSQGQSQWLSNNQQNQQSYSNPYYGE